MRYIEELNDLYVLLIFFGVVIDTIAVISALFDKGAEAAGMGIMGTLLIIVSMALLKG